MGVEETRVLDEKTIRAGVVGVAAREGPRGVQGDGVGEQTHTL